MREGGGFCPTRTPKSKAAGGPLQWRYRPGVCRETAEWVPRWLQAGRQGGLVVFTPTGLFKQSGCLYKLALSSQTSLGRSVLRKGAGDVTIMTYGTKACWSQYFSRSRAESNEGQVHGNAWKIRHCFPEFPNVATQVFQFSSEWKNYLKKNKKRGNDANLIRINRFKLVLLLTGCQYHS